MKEKRTIDRCFWLPEGCQNQINTGMNKNTIIQLGDRFGRERKIFKNVVFPQMVFELKHNMCPSARNNVYVAGQNGMIVNDAIKSLRSIGDAYVFSVHQVREVLKVVSNIDADLIDGIYFLRRKPNDAVRKEI